MTDIRLLVACGGTVLYLLAVSGGIGLSLALQRREISGKVAASAVLIWAGLTVAGVALVLRG